MSITRNFPSTHEKGFEHSTKLVQVEGSTVNSNKKNPALFTKRKKVDRFINLLYQTQQYILPGW
jgi:hypothetical protein